MSRCLLNITKAVAAEIGIKRRWLGEQGRRGLSFLSGVLPRQHVTLEFACEPSRRKPLAASCIAAAVQRNQGRAPSLHVSAHAAHRAPDILDNVCAGKRTAQFLWQSKPRNGGVSSMPSRIEPETPDQSRSRRRARLGISFSALSASSSSHACRNTRRTKACNDFGNRSRMLRALWTDSAGSLRHLRRFDGVP